MSEWFPLFMVNAINFAKNASLSNRVENGGDGESPTSYFDPFNTVAGTLVFADGEYLESVGAEAKYFQPTWAWPAPAEMTFRRYNWISATRPPFRFNAVPPHQSGTKFANTFSGGDIPFRMTYRFTWGPAITTANTKWGIGGAVSTSVDGDSSLQVPGGWIVIANFRCRIKYVHGAGNNANGQACQFEVYGVASFDAVVEPFAIMDDFSFDFGPIGYTSGASQTGVNIYSDLARDPVLSFEYMDIGFSDRTV